jgi:hypothetical protein
MAEGLGFETESEGIRVHPDFSGRDDIWCPHVSGRKRGRRIPFHVQDFINSFPKIGMLHTVPLVSFIWRGEVKWLVQDLETDFLL